MSLVIVALPSEDDLVWQISSEKIPHLTLLYLGESTDLVDTEEIAEFLQHASSAALTRFYLDVDRRGVLGKDKADVLFFSNGSESEEIKRFRHQLLQNNEIQKAYSSVEQFSDWQPHLTLGYPESPAKPNPDNYGLSWVRFDRIALWVDNYEGPEFVLKRPELEVSMGDVVEDILKHYGVKGMRWGVRGGASSVGPSSSDAKTAAKAKRKAQTSGVKSLSNQELRDLNQRLQLEQTYNNLNPTTVGKGQKFVGQHLKSVSGMAISAAAAKYLIKHI